MPRPAAQICIVALQVAKVDKRVIGLDLELDTNRNVLHSKIAGMEADMKALRVDQMELKGAVSTLSHGMGEVLALLKQAQKREIN